MIVGIVVLSLVIVLAYPVYAIVVWNTSKSPDDIAKFPTDGLWVCEQDNFVITIDLRNTEDSSSAIETMQVSIEFNGTRQMLEIYQHNGHGTPLSPSVPAHILYFESADLKSDDTNYVQFSTSKYKFNDNDFYLLDIYSRNDQASIVKPNTDLHFVKQV